MTGVISVIAVLVLAFAALFFTQWVHQKTESRRYLTHPLKEALALDLDHLRSLEARVTPRPATPEKFTRLRHIRETEDALVALLQASDEPGADPRALVTQRNAAVARLGIHPAELPTTDQETDA